MTAPSLPLDLFTDLGRAALAAAEHETDPNSLRAGENLRAEFGPELAAAALNQAALRARSVTKMGPLGAELFWTSDGLEQATRWEVAQWRAARWQAAGARGVLDLGCGVGIDSLACQQAGLAVIAVERDEFTAACARANLAAATAGSLASAASLASLGDIASVQGAATVLIGDAEEISRDLMSRLDDRWVIFLDPSRRTARGRSWNVADFSPSWDFVLAVLAGRHPACIKLGPGLPKQLIPSGVESCWVSHRGDVVEAGLWRWPGQVTDGHATSAAVLLPGPHRLAGPRHLRSLDVAEPGRYLLEPDGAVIRAGLISEICPDRDLWLLDAHVAYLSSNDLVRTPFAEVFEIVEDFAYSEKALRQWTRQHHIGVLEIKKRAIELDPAQLRKRLKLAGSGSATVIIARAPSGTRALICQRC